jgi:hypothetical protein
MSTLSICDRIMLLEDGRVGKFDRPETLASGNAAQIEEAILT